MLKNDNFCPSMNRQKSSKTCLAILCGGPGRESGVSLCSARNIYELTKNDYISVFLYMDKSSRFHLFHDGSFLEGEGNVLKTRVEQEGFELYEIKEVAQRQGLSIDLVFPIIHGSPLEDGKIQVLFESLQVPYLGCDSASSFLCFDKGLFKSYMSTFCTQSKTRFDLIPWKIYQRGIDSPEGILDLFKNQNIYLKPVQEGSSFGVHRVSEPEKRVEVLKDLLNNYKRILVEPEVKGRELEVALLETRKGWVASEVGEINLGDEKFYSYEAKYGEKSSVKTGLASLPSKLSVEFRELSIELAKRLGARGFLRMDYFLDVDSKILLNEVNTHPGCTGISMFPVLLADSGFEGSRWIDELIAAHVYRVCDSEERNATMVEGTGE